MRSPIAAAALAGIALPGVVSAQTPPPAPRPMADGVLTREETLARADKRFDALDTDRDGKISAAERAAMPQRPRGSADGATPMPGRRMGDRMLERADADRDGVITRDEFRAVAARAFDRQDANRDGRVDAAERKEWRDQRMARRGGEPAE
ncbi:EF-hand domain-containing protein [Sphingomonas sp. 2R-10]|uniref:EF-hand domain-containing protein n=1 Tax=Sphingomonas sp. 2R-10 TaxID=3045148 RepID=UPI000F77EAF3|nr:EF-hand domain-containing protein [Sphingomonas sp. 2R-10]MDJ0278513.1 EF-hand domain-containing protein [Sphingomonas sp. 2R-10]